MDRTLQARLENEPLLGTAADWFFELRSDNISGERIAEWQQWLAQDAAHREAFERIESFWRLSDQVTTHWPTDAEVAQDDYSGAESISAWRRKCTEPVASVGTKPGLHRLSRAPRFAAALAGAVVLGVAAVLVFQSLPALYVALHGGARVAVETQVGEMRTLTLPDGSALSAGGDTALVVTMLPHSRAVTLERGEAYFRVAKDPSRPFTVQAGSTAVTAVGTAFDVRRTKNEVMVAVAEGIVRVAAPAMQEQSSSGWVSPVTRRDTANPASQLKAGQRLSVGGAGSASEVSSVDTNSVAGWREGRLQYLNEPLELIIADLARYSSRSITIEDSATAALRVTGVIFPQNIDNWLTSLETTLPIHVTRQSDETIIITRKQE